MRTNNSSAVNYFMAFICSHSSSSTYFVKKASICKHVINIVNFTKLSPGQYTPLLTKHSEETKRFKESGPPNLNSSEMSLKLTTKGAAEKWLISAILCTFMELKKGRKCVCVSSPCLHWFSPGSPGSSHIQRRAFVG